jgi:nucleoside-diphosphate-sugar epimerase
MVKRVLLTGGTGFIGANLVRRLLDRGDDVHLLVRPDHRRARIAAIERAVTLHRADLADQAAVAAVVAAVRPEWIFHLATHGAYAWETDPGAMLRATVMGTANLVLACAHRGFEAFVNAGSSSEYGAKDHAPAVDEPLEPCSAYGVNKAWASQFCRHIAVSQALPLCTLRLYSVFGPWEDPRRLIPTLIRSGRAGAFPPLVSADAAHDFIYIADVAEAFVAAASRPAPGRIYNVGTGRQTTMREVAEVARRVLGIVAEPRWGTMPNRPWDSGVWVADIAPTVAALGWRPQYDFEAGLRRTVEWAAAHPAALVPSAAAATR